MVGTKLIALPYLGLASVGVAHDLAPPECKNGPASCLKGIPLPRVTAERVNVGVILSCVDEEFLDVRIEVDESRLLILDPRVDLDAIRDYRNAWGVYRDRRPELYGPLMTLDGHTKR